MRWLCKRRICMKYETNFYKISIQETNMYVIKYQNMRFLCKKPIYMKYETNSDKIWIQKANMYKIWKHEITIDIVLLLLCYHRFSRKLHLLAGPSSVLERVTNESCIYRVERVTNKSCTADCRYGGTESRDEFENVFNEPEFYPWNLRLVPRNRWSIPWESWYAWCWIESF